jgi:hypothetical protein
MTRLRRFAASARQAPFRRFAASARQARRARAFVTTLALLAASTTLRAHSGPPFPIVNDAVRGRYTISIWTDPDTTDDGSAGGQFWVVLWTTPNESRIPADTRVTVSARPAGTRDEYGRESPRAAISAAAAPVGGDFGNQFAALVMSREGRYDIRVDVDGPLGRAVIDSSVDATYDLRPPPYMLAWYLTPFLLVGFLWTRLLLRRRKLPALSRVEGLRKG